MRSERLLNTAAHQSSWLVPPRREQQELLDLGLGSPEDVDQNLNEMWRANRYLGGLRALTWHPYPRLTTHKGITITLADLGTGSAQIPNMIARWARSRHVAVQIIGVDWVSRNLMAARPHRLPGIHLLQADANQLPFIPEGVDYIISSLFLHHFSPEQVVQVLRAAFNCARRGIIMTDLVRGWLPLAAFRLAGPVIARNFLTRHDGALSIRRAYTPIELRELAAAAGLSTAVVYTHPFWRMTLVADK